MERLRLFQHESRISFKGYSQKYRNWYQKLGDFEIPNKIQSREYSRDGGRDGFWYGNASYGECQLEWRRLERERQLG